jgi:hypothetical protein
LTIANVSDADAGEYVAGVWNACGNIASRTAIQPNLQIFESDDVFTLTWSDASAVLEQADDPAGPWTEVVGAKSPFHPSAFGATKFFRFRVVVP